MNLEIKVSAKFGNYSGEYTIEIGSEENMKESIFEELKSEFPEIEEDEQAGSESVEFDVTDWLDLEDYPSLQKIYLLEELADYNGNYSEKLDVIGAAVDADIQISNIDEAYNGHFRDDEEFAQEMAESCGYMSREVHWPFTCIDWTKAAIELMCDYTVSNGYYFRNL